MEPRVHTYEGWKDSEADTSIDDLVQAALMRIYSTESYLRCQVSPLTWVTNAVSERSRSGNASTSFRSDDEPGRPVAP